MNINERIWSDFIAFSKAQISTGDIDPMYPVLKRFYVAECLDRESSIWRTLLYTAWYHIGSAAKAWTLFQSPTDEESELLSRLPTGVERRGFRGSNRAWQNIRATICRAHQTGNSLDEWLSRIVSEGGWDAVRLEFQSIPGNGPWSSYKWADLLKNVHDFQIQATDLGVGGNGESAGPIPGMVRITGEPWKECALNKSLQKDLLNRAIDSGVPFSGLDQLETALCDFNSLCKGHYYVGHDIDQQIAQLAAIDFRVAGLWEARDVFRSELRGEFGGWSGVRSNLKSMYLESRVIYNREFGEL